MQKALWKYLYFAFTSLLFCKITAYLSYKQYCLVTLFNLLIIVKMESVERPEYTVKIIIVKEH